MAFILSACPAYRNGDMIVSLPFTDLYPRKRIESKTVAGLIVSLKAYVLEIRIALPDAQFRASVYCSKDQRKPSGFDASKHDLTVFHFIEGVPEPKNTISILGSSL